MTPEGMQNSVQSIQRLVQCPGQAQKHFSLLGQHAALLQVRGGALEHMATLEDLFTRLENTGLTLTLQNVSMVRVSWISWLSCQQDRNQANQEEG